ncbi:hypothetical protein GS445_15545 [Rhodococcus hoagii]|nr:hypothetical protein [Prescottella equi]NKV83019.1 hypothetical protein [Prescottella equi]
MRSSASGWRPRSQERHTSPDDSTATTATGTTNDASITLTYTRYPSTDVPATLPRVLAASTRGVCSPMRLRKRTDAIATTTYATITAPRTTSLRSPNTTPVPSTANVPAPRTTTPTTSARAASGVRNDACTRPHQRGSAPSTPSEYTSRDAAFDDAIDEASHEQLSPTFSATTMTGSTPVAVPCRYASTRVSLRPVQAAQPANRNSDPQISGVSNTVRVTVTSGRRASGPKKAALSNPASANSAVRTSASVPCPDAGGTRTGADALSPNSIRATMKASEHISTARIVTAANRTPRTRQHRMPTASARYTGGAGGENPASPHSAITA